MTTFATTESRDATPDSAVTAIYANQTEWLLRLATGEARRPDVEGFHTRIWRTGELLAARTGTSGVILTSGSDGPASDYDLVLSWLHATGCGDLLIWSAAPNDHANRTLLARGANDGFRPHWMFRALDRAVPTVVPPARIALASAVAVDLPELVASRGIPYVEEAQLRTMMRLAGDHGDGDDVRVVIAREITRIRRTRIVGVAAINVVDVEGRRIAGLFNLGVQPEMRRRGIGTALTLAALAAAQQMGATAIGLNATGDGERVYRKLGFRSAGFGQTWFMPAARLHHRPSPEAIAQAEALSRGDLARLDPDVARVGLLPNGDAPIAYAARFGRAEVARWLLAHGAAPDIIALWRLGMRKEAIDLMAEPRHLNRIAGQHATTPLHDAVVDDDVELVRLLLAAGADPTIRDSLYHATAAAWAYYGGHDAVARLLPFTPAPALG